MATTLVALTGSEKQVAWAEDVRAMHVGELTGWREDAVADGDTEDAARFAAALAGVGRVTSAKWWIDRRFYGTDEMVDALKGA